MMQAKRWSSSAGTRGINRVRAYEGRSGLLFVEYRERDVPGEKPRRVRHSLGHRDRVRARMQVRAIAARLVEHPTTAEGGITLGSLFDIYLVEVTPRKGESKQAHDRRAAAMFLRLFGRDRGADTLNLRDWEGFIDQRRSGLHTGDGVPRRVGARQVAYDLSWLRAVLRWATLAGADGKPLLVNNPVQGYPLPREQSPSRPVLTETQYQALLEAARGINWLVRLAVLLANETGHRISAIRQLRWSDLDCERGWIRWRAKHDKIGFEHVTPMSPTLQAELIEMRQRMAMIGDAWVLPAVRDPSQPCSRGTLDKWLQEARRSATLLFPPRAGWHSLRRKFATELQDLPLKELCYLGGWKDAKTLLECYQQPDETVMRHALAQRRRFGEGGVSSGRFNGHHGKTPDLPVLRNRF